MKKNTLEDYKKEIRAKYEMEKLGVHSSLLLNPSRAKLRNLCFELLKDNPSKDDLMSFSSFFGFEFSATNFNTLKGLTDKFRPIETFLKGETDLMDIEGMNIAAILVGFESRPYLKFSKTERVINEQLSDNEYKTAHLLSVDSNTDTKDNEKVQGQMYQALKSKENNRNIFLNKPIIVAVFLVVLMGCFVFISSKVECMQWQNDHYEIVDCGDSKVGVVNLFSKVPLDKNMLHFKRIQVCDTTTFFKYEKPVVWYCKKGKELEFFNSPGFNPENNKPLKPITQYMIDKYVSKK
ncbi:hypothetical protein AAGV28_07290 [Flavobacterium sp. FZUC8N2.13]|uniref:Helix-turn-helix domain-containing protein n=1 Tax=Flavobacterium zubiriense TaxID=3138075 RepID=A0ABV4TAP5_9FLAO